MDTPYLIHIAIVGLLPVLRAGREVRPYSGPQSHKFEMAAYTLMWMLPNAEKPARRLCRSSGHVPCGQLLCASGMLSSMMPSEGDRRSQDAIALVAEDTCTTCKSALRGVRRQDAISLVAEGLAAGRVSFFLGAGASLHEVAVDDSERAEASLNRTARLLSAGELSARLAERLAVPPCFGRDLMQITTSFELLVGRRALVDELHYALEEPSELGEIHHFLAMLDSPLFIVTTNYDRYIERAFHSVGRRYHLVTNVFHRDWHSKECILWFPPEDTENKNPTVVGYDHVFDESYPLIFKVHGSLGMPGEFRDGLVISEEDYYEMAWREHRGKLVPYHVAARLSRSTIVFVGYGLRDIHLNHALLLNQPRDRRHFLFTKKVKYCDWVRFNSLRIEAVECDCDTFARSTKSALALH